MASTSGYRPVETYTNEDDDYPPSSPLTPRTGHTRENSRSSLLLNNPGSSSNNGGYSNSNMARGYSLESTRSTDGLMPSPMSPGSPKRLGKITEGSDLDDDDEDEDEFPSAVARSRSQAERVKEYEEGGSDERSGFAGTLRRLSRGLAIHLGKSRTGTQVLGAGKKGRKFFHDNRGLLMIAAAQACFASMNVMVQLMTQNAEVAVPIWELILTRMWFTWGFCYIILRIRRVKDPLLGPKPLRGWLTIRGLVGFFGLFGSYSSLQYLSLSDCTVLSFLSPTFTGLLAYLLLREPYTGKEAIAGLISLGGTILVAQPSFIFGGLAEEENGITPEQRLQAVGMALLGVCGASGAYVTIRKIGKQVDALIVVEYFCMGCTIIGIAMPLFLSQPFVMPSKPIFWFYLTAIGVFGFTAQFLLGRALQIERVGRAMLGNYTQLPWALLLQYLIFGEVMDLLSTCGAAIIMGSTLWVVLSKNKHKTPEEPSAAAKDDAVDKAPADIESGRLLRQEAGSEEGSLQVSSGNGQAARLETGLLSNSPFVTAPPPPSPAIALLPSPVLKTGGAQQ